jgi:hypothetical protein
MSSDTHRHDAAVVFYNRLSNQSGQNFQKHMHLRIKYATIVSVIMLKKIRRVSPAVLVIDRLIYDSYLVEGFRKYSLCISHEHFLAVFVLVLINTLRYCLNGLSRRSSWKLLFCMEEPVHRTSFKNLLANKYVIENYDERILMLLLIVLHLVCVIPNCNVLFSTTVAGLASLTGDRPPPPLVHQQVSFNNKYSADQNSGRKYSMHSS